MSLYLKIFAAALFTSLMTGCCVDCGVSKTDSDASSDEVQASAETVETSTTLPVMEVQAGPTLSCEPVPEVDHCPPEPTQCLVDSPSTAPTSLTSDQ
jgi:hypothetical protein